MDLHMQTHLHAISRYDSDFPDIRYYIIEYVSECWVYTRCQSISFNIWDLLLFEAHIRFLLVFLLKVQALGDPLHHWFPIARLDGTYVDTAVCANILVFCIKIL